MAKQNRRTFPIPDMPCYPYVTKEHRTIMNDLELLDWIREKAGDDMAELVDMRTNDNSCYLTDVQSALDVLKDDLVYIRTSVDEALKEIGRWEKNG